MAQGKTIKGGSTAPVELMYAAVLALNAIMENPLDNEAKTTSKGIIELIKVAERLPVPIETGNLPMSNLIAAATGLLHLGTDNFSTQESLIIPEVRNVVLNSIPAQQCLNSYMEREFGRVFDFAPQPDSLLIMLSQTGTQQERENS